MRAYDYMGIYSIVVLLHLKFNILQQTVQIFFGCTIWKLYMVESINRSYSSFMLLANSTFTRIMSKLEQLYALWQRPSDFVFCSFSFLDWRYGIGFQWFHFLHLIASSCSDYHYQTSFVCKPPSFSLNFSYGVLLIHFRTSWPIVIVLKFIFFIFTRNLSRFYFFALFLSFSLPVKMNCKASITLVPRNEFNFGVQLDADEKFCVEINIKWITLEVLEWLSRAF